MTTASKNTTKIFDIMKSYGAYKGDRKTGTYGIEIETETSGAYDYPAMKFWSCTRDGSLRDFGVEYVMKGPVQYEDLDSVLNEFAAQSKKFKFKKDSVSTSVHVHTNMLNETFLTLSNFLTIYSLCENLLIKYSGPDRLSNLFCMPMRDAEGVIQYIEAMLQAVNRGMYHKLGMSPDQVKYGAINCAPLTKWGSVELRSFRGETDIVAIKKWVSIIEKMRKFASNPELTPVIILDMYRKKRGDIIKDIFGELAKDLDCKEREGLITKNLWFAAKIATVSKDWKTFGVIKPKPVFKAQLMPTLDKLMQDRYGKNYEEASFAEQVIINEVYEARNPAARIIEFAEDM